jgi:hypothetical protein
MSNHVVEGVKGSVAAGSITAPTPMYGSFLTTNGFGLLSYAEWMQVLGSIYVAYLLLKALSNSSVGKRLRDKISKWFN